MKEGELRISFNIPVDSRQELNWVWINSTFGTLRFLERMKGKGWKEKTGYYIPSSHKTKFSPSEIENILEQIVKLILEEKKESK